MNFQAIKNQFLHDLRVSWQKTALLALLFVVGLMFWIPPLVRRFNKKKSPYPVAVAAQHPTDAKLAVGSPSHAGAATEQPDAKKVDFTWERGEKLLRTAALVRSVEVAALNGDPFRINRDQFPPPVLFEAEPLKSPDVQKPVEVKQTLITDANLAQKLVLKSTIVGARRRAAFINDRLYYEGREIQVDGQTFLLSLVSPRKVLLKQGTSTFELVIPSTFGANSIDRYQPLSK